MSSSENILLRSPLIEDGMATYRLIKRCPPLDTNSSYCNLLHCSHFANTSVAAEVDGELLGFISGYIIPDRTDTLFVWQVAVDEKARGLGLASRMISHILSRPHCGSVRFIETTITEHNLPSWALFHSVADKLSVDLHSSPWMDSQAHFDGLHDSETLVRIGPFALEETP
ncbi:diaminobutyrate acetyltransferase [Microbulbifer sp. CNSA002]|uniref:diaminobutyrate acetyltransferase n=1 Tax=Microbulbifer sp. CNSA002 TaxID=3373604 RepID=UPI0039B4DE94